MSQRRNEGSVGAQTEKWTSPIWNTPSRFNLHIHGHQSRPVGEYGIALDAPLPAFGQGKWVNGGPDRQEMAPIGFEMSRWTSNMANLTKSVRRQMWAEQQRDLSNIGSSTNGSASAGASTSSVHDKSTNSSPTTSLSTAGSSNITSPGTPFTAIPLATSSKRTSLYSKPTTSMKISPDGMHSADREDEAQGKGKALEKQYAELASNLSNDMPVVNMQQLKDKFEVPNTLDECTYAPSHSLVIITLIYYYKYPVSLPDTPGRDFCADHGTAAYRSLSDVADHSVHMGKLTLVESHIIARQLFHARCKTASAFAVDAAEKAAAEVAACDTAEVACCVTCALPNADADVAAVDCYR